MSIFAELKRRNVFRVGIAYAVVAWLALQIADVLIDNIGAPEWVFGTLLMVLAIGFPIALVLAWAFELTPDGIKRDNEVDRSQSVTGQTGKKLNVLIVSLLVAALAYFIWESRFSTAPAPAEPVALEPTDTAEPEEAPAVSRQSIAVLPFDNRSAQTSDEYFVEGMHDDLLTNLSRIGSLKVISRTTVNQYKDTPKTIPQIASELGVATIMEGAVQRSGDQVRINVQLIDAQTDEHLWAEIFDRQLTAENLFAIQSEISEAIAEALEATLTPAEQQRIDTLPTENLAAYDAYLRGRQLLPRRDSEELKQAVAAFRQATELDPGFALAWVGLAESLQLEAIYSGEGIASVAEESLAATKRALAIDDQLGEAYASLGVIKRNAGNLVEAIEAFEKAIELSPNYATAYHWYSRLLAFETDQFDEATHYAQRAVELDPGSPVVHASLGSVYEQVGLVSLAEAQYRKITDLFPNEAIAHAALAGILAERRGRFADSLAAANRAAELSPNQVFNLLDTSNILALAGDFARAQKVRNIAEDRFGPSRFIDAYQVFADLQQSSGAGVSEQLNTLVPKVETRESLLSSLAFVAALNGDVDLSRRIFLNLEGRWLQPESWPDLLEQQKANCFLSWVLTETGDEALGMQLTRATVEYLDGPIASQHADLDFYQPDLCYLLLGETDRALATLEIQLDHNHLGDWGLVHRLPLYDPLRLDPRYLELRQEYDRRMQEQLELVQAMEVNLGNGMTL